mgnify:CR=1 FL=1
MSELYLMITVCDWSRQKKFLSFYHEKQLSTAFHVAGHGTAANEMLDYLGLDGAEKILILSVVTGEKWKEVKAGLQSRLKIDVPGTGIAFIIPMSSIGGKRQLMFFTENQNYVKGEESSLKDTKYELLMAIANQGYIDTVMKAAREANAGGGTVVHAKGTGTELARKYLGVSLVEEKEMIFIVTRSSQKAQIMKAIMEKTGLKSKEKAIVFSLPVSSVVGLRMTEEDIKDDLL